MIAKKMTGDIDGREFKFNVEIFNGANELIDVCESRTRNPSFYEDTFGDEKCDGGWVGCKTMTEVKGYCRGNWDEKVPTVKEMIRNIQKNIPTNKPMFHNDVAGFAPVVPLVLARVPNSMINCHVEPKKSRVLDVYYDATMGCGNGPDVLIEMGMKAVEYILRAEAQGYRVRLTAVQMYYNNGSADVLMVRIKNENQPLNIQRMMFPMFHPAFFRVIGFGWYERCPTSKHRGGYGHSMAYDYDVKEMNRMFEGMLGKQAIYLSAVHIQEVHEMHGETKDEARSRLVKDTLKMEAQV